jgi:hypothetical protein
MAKFAWPWKEIGLDSEPWRYESTIPIRLGDRNLLLLRAAQSSTLQAVTYDRGRLRVEEIDNRLALGRFELYLDSLEVSGSAKKDLMDGVWPLIQHELQSLYSKLFEVTGKVTGAAKLQAGKMTQAVEVIPSASYTVSFRFLQRFRGDQEEPAAGTKRSPAEVDDWISNLNWIFGSQANITFDKGTSAWVPLNHPLGPVSTKVFKDNGLEPEKDDAADFTVFLVGKVDPGYNGHSYQPKTGESWVSMLSDYPQEPEVKSDSFILVLAHELSHCVQKDLGNTHFCQSRILRSAGIQSTVIGDVLRPLLVKPGTSPASGTVCG